MQRLINTAANKASSINAAANTASLINAAANKACAARGGALVSGRSSRREGESACAWQSA